MTPKSSTDKSSGGVSFASPGGDTSSLPISSSGSCGKKDLNSASFTIVSSVASSLNLNMLESACCFFSLSNRALCQTDM